MFIAHLPIGYLASKLIYPRLRPPVIGRKGFLIAGMAGAIAPDLDMFYFYLIDHQQHHHHSYWTHYPIAWMCLLLLSLTLSFSRRWRVLAVIMMVFSFNGLIHMLLDSVAGIIYWFAPIAHKAYGLVTVQALYEPWWLNFILHWTFLFEIAIATWAILVWRYRDKTISSDSKHIS